MRRRRRPRPSRATPRKGARGKRRAAFPPARPDEARLVRLRERLEALGFTEDAVAERLRVPHIAALALERYPVYRALLARRADPLAAAIGLFLLQEDVPRAAVAAALGEDLVRDLLAIGLLAPAGRAALRAAASVYPCAGAFFATDHRHRPPGRAAPRDPVMYLGGDSYALAYLAPAPPPGGRVLDLCTGSGVHAILAARGGARVFGIDVNPRALAFARWNAALNGVAARCEFRRGDLFAPLGPNGGELARKRERVEEASGPEAEARFDLVLANPPFVPSPHGGRARIAFRDAGPAGEEVLARLLEGLPARLARDGTAAIVSVFADARGATFRAKLERWLGPRAGLAAILFRLGAEAPEDYAAAQTRRAFGDDLAGYDARYRRWLLALRRAGLERLAGGVLALRRHPGPTPAPFRALDLAPPRRRDARAIPRALDAFAAARAIVFPDEILERPARRADDLTISDELEVRDGALAAVRHRARLRSGAGGEVFVSPELRAVLAEATGRAPLRAVIAEVAAPAALDATALAERLLPDLLELAERGLLLLDAP
jgi:methylase of polypeptide subunit release factors